MLRDDAMTVVAVIADQRARRRQPADKIQISQQQTSSIFISTSPFRGNAAAFHHHAHALPALPYLHEDTLFMREAFREVGKTIGWHLSIAATFISSARAFKHRI